MAENRISELYLDKRSINSSAAALFEVENICGWELRDFATSSTVPEIGTNSTDLNLVQLSRLLRED
jgi:hypothetical protein